jgi:hypothetical protein
VRENYVKLEDERGSRRTDLHFGGFGPEQMARKREVEKTVAAA